MTAMRSGWAALLLAAVGAPVAVGMSQAVLGQTDPAVAALSLDLARILNSEAIIIDSAADGPMLAEFTADLYESKPDLAELEREHPGIGLEIADAIMPVIDRSARNRLPELQRRQAALYARHFTAAELKAMIDFYTSPTGRKMILAMSDKLRPDAAIADMKRSDDFEVSADAALEDIRATMPEVRESLDASDLAVLDAFMQTSAMGKVRQIARETQQIALDWHDETEPGEDAELDRVIDAILDRREQQAAQ